LGAGTHLVRSSPIANPPRFEAKTEDKLPRLRAIESESTQVDLCTDPQAVAEIGGNFFHFVFHSTSETLGLGMT
jgi:hypothetical protein